jgi:TolB-like protein
MSRVSSYLTAFCAVLACYAFFAFPAAAQAAHRRVAVLRVEFVGDMPANNKDFLSERLIAGLAAAEFQVFAGLTVTQMLKQGSRLEACRQPACYQEIAQRLGVEYLVTTVVQVDRKNYQVTLDLVSGRDGKSVGQSNERCELCGIKEVGTQMDRQVLALRGYAEQAAAAAPSRFSIESRPAGAEVSIDGKASGVTPLAVDVSAGSHRMVLTAPGHKPSERNVYVDANMNGYLAVDLAPEGLPFIGGGGGSPNKLLAWGAMLLGAVAVGVGYFVYTLDGDVVGCTQALPTGPCQVETQRETSLEAGLLMGAGGVMMATGGVMLFLGSTSSPENQTTTPGTPAASNGRGNGHVNVRGWVLGARGTF